MSLLVLLRPEASQDTEQVRDYLESKRAGLGQAFLSRLRETLARITFMPQIFGVVWQNMRAARLRKFKYVVYYRVHDDRIEVLAIMHGSRDALEWQQRA